MAATPPTPDGHQAPASTNLVSIAKYRKKAADYDNHTGRTQRIRLETIDRLALQPGQVVLDTGCGTGASFELLRDRVGDSGLVVGVDQSPEMIEIARRRVTENGWQNVIVVEGFMETVSLTQRFDAILFHYTHDILRVQVAVDNLFSHVKPGAHVAVAGMKFFPWWTGPLNLYAYLKNHAWNGSASGMWRPWKLLLPKLTGWSMRPTQFGMGYIGHGRYQGKDNE